MKPFAVSVWLCCLLVADSSLATVTLMYRAHVVDVIDGNTIVVSNRVLDGGTRFPGIALVHLDGVAAPELDQPGGKEAKTFLEQLLKGKEVAVVELTDMGRSQGAWVFIGEDEKNVNVLLIEQGKAWLTEPRAKFAASLGKPRQASEKMREAYQKAKDRKLGVWASENPVPPWEWIEKHRNQKEGPAQP